MSSEISFCVFNFVFVLFVFGCVKHKKKEVHFKKSRKRKVFVLSDLICYICYCYSFSGFTNFYHLTFYQSGQDLLILTTLYKKFSKKINIQAKYCQTYQCVNQLSLFFWFALHSYTTHSNIKLHCHCLHLFFLFDFVCFCFTEIRNVSLGLYNSEHFV